jgi:hypothetical protein
MNNKLIEKLDENGKYSRQLCELLNKSIKSNIIQYTPSYSNENIGVKQLLDTTGLHYNEIWFKDEIMNTYNIQEVVNMVYVTLGIGAFKYVYPSEKEVELYKLFEENEWDIYIDQGGILLEGEDIYISDILSKEVSKDRIVLELDKEKSGYSSIIITRDNIYRITN